MTDIDFESLRHIGLTQAVVSQLNSTLHGTEGQLGRVVEVHRDCATIHDGERTLTAAATHQLMQALDAGQSALAVGDWVLTDAADGRTWILARMEPLTHLVRRTPDGRRQSLASNADTALLVMGLDHDFNMRRIERYLAMVIAAGVAPVVALTKRDAASGVEDKLDALRQRLPGHVPVIAIDGRDPGSVLQLAPWLEAGQTLILLGSSGAGKSTLTNTLTGAGQATGGVRDDDSRGRHTTTARSLHRCPGGACIIDTPGLRALSPDVDAEALAAAFDDIDALAGHCQFRDCAHDAEPGCAVREVVDPDRLHNYRKLLREARRHEQTALDRIEAVAKWKVLMKAASARGRQKRS